MSSLLHEDEQLTQAQLEVESKLLRIPVQDLRKRRIMLGKPGESGFWTGDLSQLCALHPPAEGRDKATKRSQRVSRNHKLLYVHRYFCKTGQIPDSEWYCPQHITLREDPRYPLQGRMQAEDPDSWHRYAEMHDAPPRITGVFPPQGMKR